MQPVGTMPRKLFLLAVAVSVLLTAGPAKAVSTAKNGTKTAAQPAMVMPWIEDDYAKAISEAKARKLPVFVESWAPW